LSLGFFGWACLVFAADEISIPDPSEAAAAPLSADIRKSAPAAQAVFMEPTFQVFPT
jgi:hypothetical protein